MSYSESEALLHNATGTGSAKKLTGGVYVVAMKATWGGGNIALQMLLPDGSTYLAVEDGTLTDNGAFVVELPPCTVRAVATTATACYVNIARRLG